MMRDRRIEKVGCTLLVAGLLALTPGLGGAEEPGETACPSDDSEPGYPNAPEIVCSTVRDAAATTVANLEEALAAHHAAGTAIQRDEIEAIAEDPLESDLSEVALYAVLDALTELSFAPYIFAAETARTDKQTGATSKTSGSTSLVAKPGLESILAFAIERGAIQREVNGTSATLRSSPAALLRSTYDRHAEQGRHDAWLRRIGMWVAFPVEMDGSNPSFEEVTDWGVDLNLNFLLPDGRDRSRQTFEQEWNKPGGVRDRIQAYLGALTTAIEDVDDIEIQQADGRVTVGELTEEYYDAEIAGWADLLQGFVAPDGRALTASSDSVTDALQRAILASLHKDLFVPVAGQRDSIDPEVLAMARRRVDRLAKTTAGLEGVREEIDALYAEVAKEPVFTFSYANHKGQSGGSNFYDFTLALQHKLEVSGVLLLPEAIDLVWNADIAVNTDPGDEVKDRRIRSYGISLSAEFSTENVFTPFASEFDRSRITGSLSGRFARLESADDEAGFFQAKLEIPVAAGFSLPVSVTYATRTEEIDEDEIRGNVGFSLDLDKVYALAAIAALN